jgi:SAM-dependent methyltransferase
VLDLGFLASSRAVIEQLPPSEPAAVTPSVSQWTTEPVDHPMRLVTKQAAAGEWNAHRAHEVGAFFDELAPGWNERVHADSIPVLADAFERGAVGVEGTCAELGSGTGATTAWLAARFERVLSVDVAVLMLQQAAGLPGHRVRADAAVLPFADHVLDCVVLVNMFLFPREVERVLRGTGALVWVNARAELTPIHLTADEIDTAMGDEWDGVASRCGVGSWAVMRHIDPRRRADKGVRPPPHR